jgi:hypothetical protein
MDNRLIKSLLLLLMCVPISNVFAKEGKDTDVFIKLILENDNPFLNLMPELMYVDDDHGYTHGLGLEIEIFPENSIFKEDERWTIGLNSKLYTKDVTPEGEDLFPNDPQKFNEVSRLDVTWDDLFESQRQGKAYYAFGTGVGYINNSHDDGWGAAGQQRRWHDYKHNELTPETTPMYDNQYGDVASGFLIAKAAIGKSVKFHPEEKDYHCELNSIKVEAGVDLITIKMDQRPTFF